MNGTTDDKIMILALAANPRNTSRLGLDQEVCKIEQVLERSQYRDRFELKSKWAVTLDDFYQHLLCRPQIVHFLGHGGGEAGIVLEDATAVIVKDEAGKVLKKETSRAKCLSTEQLVSLFSVLASEGVKCVVLNACMTDEQAKQISTHIDYVVGMNKPIGDGAAIAFSEVFYSALGAGKTVEFAFEFAKSRLIEMKEQETPVLHKRLGLTSETRFVQTVETVPKPQPEPNLSNKSVINVKDVTVGTNSGSFVIGNGNSVTTSSSDNL